jgi:membrane associated rhomboid family serine protease
MLPIGDNIPGRNPPIATWLLILVNSFVFLVEVALPPPEQEAFVYVFALVPARGDSWQFLTNMFIHGGWLHVIANLWTLWIFGDNVEDRMGSVRFVVFYLLCGLAGNFMHYFMYPDSTIPALGASGAIAGVLGAYFVLFPYARVIVLFPVLFIPFFFELPAVVYLAFWALSQFYSGTLALALPEDVGGVGWWVHVGGFIAGVLLHFLFVRRDRPALSSPRDLYGVDAAWVPTSHWRKDR